MQISVISAFKSEMEFKKLGEKYAKLISNFAKFTEICAFNGKIAAAQKVATQKSFKQDFAENLQKRSEIFSQKGQILQKQDPAKIAVQKAYADALKPYKKGFCVILHERGEQFSSVEFSQILTQRAEISFFIGGAFGFEDEFVSEFDLALSLTRLTLAHEMAKIVLLEQIYRGFCIAKNHPYHKWKAFMDKKNLNNFEKILNERRMAILAQLDSSNRDVEGLFGSEPNDNVDFSTITTSSQIEQTISENLRAELNDIARSLGKIRAGNYGICELCEDDIDLNRLKIKPHARYCKNCREIIEKEKKG